MNGLLATACAYYPGTAIAQWRLLFLLVGLITLAWSLVLFWLLPANPTSAWWLTLRQRVIATRRLAVTRTGIANSTFKGNQFREAVLDPKTWLYFFINVVLNIPNGGLVTFNSIIVNSLGFDVRQTALLGIPTGEQPIVVPLTFRHLLLDLVPRLRLPCCQDGPAVLRRHGRVPHPVHGHDPAVQDPAHQHWRIAGVAVSRLLLLVRQLTRNKLTLRGPYIVMMGSVYANTAGYTKKMIVYAIAYMGYCVGNIVGPQTFQAKDAPKYTGGVVAMLVCYGVAIVLIAAYRSVGHDAFDDPRPSLTRQFCVYLNKRKACELEAHVREHGDSTDMLDQWQDQTDFENPRFHFEL